MRAQASIEKSLTRRLKSLKLESSASEKSTWWVSKCQNLLQNMRRIKEDSKSNSPSLNNSPKHKKKRFWNCVSTSPLSSTCSKNPSLAKLTPSSHSKTTSSQKKPRLILSTFLLWTPLMTSSSATKSPLSVNSQSSSSTSTRSRSNYRRRSPVWLKIWGRSRLSSQSR